MGVKSCTVNLAEFFNGKSKKEIAELTDYVDKVRSNVTDRAALMGFMRSFAHELELDLNTKNIAELDTIGKHALAIDRMSDPKWGGDIKQAALSFYEETSSVVKGAGINAERMIQAKQKAYFGTFIAHMQKIGFLNELKTGAFDKAIRDVIRTGVQATGNFAKEINSAAQILKTLYAIMNREMRAAGVFVNYRADYDGPVVHNGSEILGRFGEWVSDLDDSLDFRKEFPEVSDADYAEFLDLKNSGRITENNTTNPIVSILKGSYDKITLEESLLLDEVPRSVSKRESLAARRARPKTFTTWKNGEALSNYLQKYGKYKTLAEQMEYYSRMTAKDVGLTSVFGGSPKKGHEMIKDHVISTLKASRASSTDIKIAEQALDTAWGNLVDPKIPNAGAIGQFFMTVRQLAATAKLGKAGLTSLFLDPVMSAKQRRDLFNESLVQSVYKTYREYIPAMKDAAMRADVEDAFLFNQYDQMTTFEELYYMGRGATKGDSKLQNGLALGSEIVNKASLGYFFNKTSHITNARMYVKFLADAVNEKKLSPAAKADLEKFNITDKDLQIVSKLGLNTKEGMRNIFRLSVEEFRDLSPDYYESHLDASDALASFKEKMVGWTMEKIRTGAPIPGNRERRILYGDTIAGTRDGEIKRYLGQFKNTALKVMVDSTYGSVRRTNPEGVQSGFDKKMWNNRHTYNSMGTLAAHMTAAGAGLLLLNAVLNGDEETLKRFEEGDPTLVLDSFARGGGGLILGDIVAFNENWLQNLAQLSSPAISSLVKIPANTARAVKGKPGVAAVDTVKSFVPGANLWFLSPFTAGMDNYVEKSSSRRSKSILK